MDIDIISYTPAQYAKLSEEQILKIESAQLKKNKLRIGLEEDLKKEKFKLVKNGTFLSSIWKSVQERLQEAYEQEVEAIRDGLLFYLQYCSKPKDEESSASPYLVDYSLSVEERLQIVKTYYETAFTNKQDRINAFRQDTVAVQYLGELYAPLYDYLLTLT